ncbi:hypothetical protein F2P81_017823 [Scophthalmus maximus]|uniref:Uncharacterized protein n=1 Tax=Scophthalmus maximus TaxID=52904 RepID=A0A6A4S911_SCOMX|nr:hypothetical protein F2P81_017823 [Scophthalmus maximus]
MDVLIQMSAKHPQYNKESRTYLQSLDLLTIAASATVGMCSVMDSNDPSSARFFGPTPGSQTLSHTDIAGIERVMSQKGFGTGTGSVPDDDDDEEDVVSDSSSLFDLLVLSSLSSR